MANCKEIVIDGVKYTPDPKTINTSPVRIVVLQRGWVVVGRYERDGDNCKLYNAQVIRNWGTTKGLGEIAGEGPKKDTKLDPTNGLVEFHRLTEVMSIMCAEEKWASSLK